MKLFYFLLATFILAGCAPRASTKLSTSEPLTSQYGPVCILRAPLPENIESRKLGFIKASNRSYGSVGAVLEVMADDARKIGADAVINVKAGQRMGFLAWARPVANGEAVKIVDKEAFDCVRLGGEIR